MAEKLLYLQNGVYKRKEVNNGLLTYNNNTFTSVSPTKNGSFYLKVDETGMSFEEKIDALQTVNPDDMNYTPIDSNAHIIYVDASNNFQSITIPSAKTWFNSISYKNGNWTFDQMSIYRQMGGSATITGFGLPLIDGNTSNKIVTLQANETGKYVLDYTNGNTSPTLDKLSVDVADLKFTPSTGYNRQFLMVDSTGNFTSIPMKNNLTWINGFQYYSESKKWEGVQLTLYNMCGWTGNINGVGIPIITTNKSNSYITLPAAESGDYMFSYSGNNTTLKKFDSSFSAITGLTGTGGLLYNNNGEWGNLTSKTNGNFYLKYVEGVPNLEPVPASVAKISQKLIFDAKSTQLTNSMSTSTLTCEGTNNFTVGKNFLITCEFSLYAADIEAILNGFKSIPTLKVQYNGTDILEICLANPMNYVHCTGNGIITTNTKDINLSFLLEGDVTVDYVFASDIKVNLIEI